MAEVKKTVDVIDPVQVRHDGLWKEMSLAEAAELDHPEGTVVVHISATLLDMLVSR